jgi:hypothetical protein
VRRELDALGGMIEWRYPQWWKVPAPQPVMLGSVTAETMAAQIEKLEELGYRLRPERGSRPAHWEHRSSVVDGERAYRQVLKGAAGLKENNATWCHRGKPLEDRHLLRGIASMRPDNDLVYDFHYVGNDSPLHCRTRDACRLFWDHRFGVDPLVELIGSLEKQAVPFSYRAGGNGLDSAIERNRHRLQNARARPFADLTRLVMLVEDFDAAGLYAYKVTRNDAGYMTSVGDGLMTKEDLDALGVTGLRRYSAEEYAWLVLGWDLIAPWSQSWERARDPERVIDIVANDVSRILGKHRRDELSDVIQRGPIEKCQSDPQGSPTRGRRPK